MTDFHAFHLPGETEFSTRRLSLEGEASAALLYADLDRASARRLVGRLEATAGPLRSRSNQDLVQVLGRAASRLGDDADELGSQVDEWLPRETGLSSAMARLLTERMVADWTEEALDRLLAEEFPDPEVLEGFRPGPVPDRVRAMGEAPAFHLGAGNVAGVGATSMIRSLLVRSPVLIKPGRGDIVLPCLLARAIAREDRELGRAVAVAYWPGGSRPPLEEEALRGAGRVVVYGGVDTLREIRDRLPVTTPLVAYRHRVSVGAVGRERLRRIDEARKAARAAAGAVAAYDQLGCVSPHQIWVEAGGGVSPERWAELLADALAELAEELPPGTPDPETVARIQQFRGAAELRRAGGGDDRLLASAGSVDWTVIYGPGKGLEAVCGGRLVRVHPLDDLTGLAGVLADGARWLQSVALEVGDERKGAVAEALAALGMTRITTFGRQAWPSPWWTHDGQGPLRTLVRWTTLEGRVAHQPARNPEGDGGG